MEISHLPPTSQNTVQWCQLWVAWTQIPGEENVKSLCLISATGRSVLHNLLVCFGAVQHSVVAKQELHAILNIYSSWPVYFHFFFLLYFKMLGLELD